VPQVSDPSRGGHLRPGDDAAGVETVIRRARWFAAVLTALQFTLYVAPDGLHLPFPRWWGALPVGLLIAVNLEGLRRLRRGTAFAPGWVTAQIAADGGIMLLLISMFTFDPTSALWTLLIMPVLESVLRGWSRRSLAVFGVLAAAYVVHQAVATFVVHRPGGSVDSVTYRIGVLGIVTTASALLAGRLTRQIAGTAAARAEAAQLRDLAVATRRMSSLDVPTVVREVTGAAEAFGFTGVRLLSRNDGLPGGAVAGHAVPAWFDAAATAAEDSGYAVFDDTTLPDGEAVEAPGQGVVVATVTAGGAVEALLAGVHDLPVDPGDAEGLVLLAAHASAALGNALRFEEGRAYEQRLAHQATHDALTGLPNRALLRDRARDALAAGRRGGTCTGLLYIDLDRFKEINDVLGHGTGDRLLQQVATRVTGRLRPGDTCARVGGDEFVVVSGGHAGPATLFDLAGSLRGALVEPFTVNGLELDVEASVGLAWAPEHGADVDVLLRRADVAMYAAKTRREGVVAYREADDRLTPVHLSTLGDLRRAVDAPGQLVPHYQPIVELSGAAGGPVGRFAGVEALVRWHHPVRGLLVPDDFIPVAEGTSVIHRITDRVLELSLAAVRDWGTRGLRPDLAVNISARALLDESFSRRLSRLLDGSGVAAGRLRLEITESTLLNDPARAVVTMHRLRELGVCLSIDDFGTGWSSMSHLKTLPLDEIKIDRSFVSDMVRSPRDAAVVHAIVDLAHSLGLRVVAEGVEDAEVLVALAATGCDMAQGFHIGRPMTARQVQAWAGSPVPGQAAGAVPVPGARVPPARPTRAGAVPPDAPEAT